ncbi:MAG: tRNA 2-thiocytidine biosynthesis TtcA family protein [Chlamydiota bacterium]|nr:tRNA 2-thiocytidine biosynthesis TtcA family protein [Chlamydiota bacterium]
MDIPVAQPPWTGIGKKVERRLRKALYDYHMVDGVTKVSVALSGGKDSLTLLFLLKSIAGRGFPDFDLSAIHVSGEFSCGAGVNTDYLRAICEKLEVPLVIRESTQRLETLECYSCSRERRRLLFDAAKELGSHTIAFGHHRDDSIQTLLMNLLHKAEFAGNMPKIHMKKYGVTIIRPLIYVTEEEIRAFARHYQFMRIMCQCPVGQNSMRKKAEVLLSEIEETFPDARHNLAKAIIEYGSNKALDP